MADEWLKCIVCEGEIAPINAFVLVWKAGNHNEQMTCCEECLDGIRFARKRLMKQVEQEAALTRKMAATGPVAITEHIMIAPEPLRLKVIDHRKGYWAEAPLSPDSIRDLIAILEVKE